MIGGGCFSGIKIASYFRLKIQYVCLFVNSAVLGPNPARKFYQISPRNRPKPTRKSRLTTLTHTYTLSIFYVYCTWPRTCSYALFFIIYTIRKSL